MKSLFSQAMGELRPDADAILRVADRWMSDSETPEQADAMRRALASWADDLNCKAAELAAKRDALNEEN